VVTAAVAQIEETEGVEREAYLPDAAEEAISPYQDQDQGQEVGEKMTSTEYAAPVAYILEYPMVEKVDGQIRKIVSEIQYSFDRAYKTGDIQSVGTSEQKDCDTILYLTYESYLAGESLMTLVFHETHETGASERFFEKTTIYHFDLVSGEQVTIDEYKNEGYREAFSDYIMEYFRTSEDYRDSLIEGYEQYLVPSAKAYDDFAMTGQGIIIYFESASDFSEEAIAVHIPYADLEGTIDDVFATAQVPMADERSAKNAASYEPEVTENNRVIDPAKPMVAITYDDGPHPVYTEAILDVLEEYNTVATFFDLGERMMAYPETVRREAALGCEVGSHSYAHKRFIKMTSAEIIEDVASMDAVFMEILGYKPTLFRPPYGEYDGRVSELIPMSVIIWSVDTRDWESKNADAIMDHIVSQGDLDGKVILMHGIYESSAEATQRLVPYLLEEGYQIVTVSELMEFKYEEVAKAGFVYGYAYFHS